jgi:hypothetical protein
MHTAHRKMRGIHHVHDPSFTWIPEKVNAVTTVENAKAISAMASPMAMVTRIMGTEWQPRSSPDVHVYRLPTDYAPDIEPEPSRIDQFGPLADTWEEETAFTSAVKDMVVNQNYQDLIGMGHPSLPLIFERLETSPTRWILALRAVVGHDVAADATTSADAVSRWLDWGHANGYIS